MHCTSTRQFVLWKAYCVSLLSASAAAWKLPFCNLKGTSFCSVVASRITPSTPTPFVQTAKFAQIEISDNILVRIRSNLGTWRLDLPEDDDNSLTISTIQTNEKFAKYRFALPLSLDQAGKQPLDAARTLQKQGIQHGTMLFCRLEEKTTEEIAKNDSTLEPCVQKAAELTQNTKRLSHRRDRAIDAPQESLKGKKNLTSDHEVIDLLDSDDEDEVQIVATKKAPKASTSNKSESSGSQPRKRQRSTGTSDNEGATASNKKRSSITSTSSSGRSSSPQSLSTSYSNISKFQVASYNVWFGPQQGTTPAGQVFPKERMTAIVNAVQKACMARPDSPLVFVGLQELTPSLVDHITPLLSQMGFRLCTQPLSGLMGGSYGVGVAVPRDMTIVKHEFVPYSNSVQGRGLLYVKTPTMLLATTHLESFMTKEMDGAAQREEQLVVAARFCKQQMDDSASLKFAAIMGDLNWDDERVKKTVQGPNRPLLSLLPEGWKDAGERFDYTYDTKENPMFTAGLRRRFDRCIYYSKKDSVACNELQKIGEKAVPGLFWDKMNPYNGSTKRTPVAPSDHFGIVMSFGPN
jgi:hypothetical protein